MRREGYELALSRPQVVTREIDGKIHEPIESMLVDVDEQHMGRVIEMVSTRGGEMGSRSTTLICSIR